MARFTIRGQEFDKLVFVHLTKTAGGTLKEAVRNEPSLSTSFVYGQQDWVHYDRTRHTVIYGHPNEWLHGKVGKPLDNSGDRFAYITFLRHPITRSISHFYHLVNIEKGELGERMRSYKDINDFFANDYHWEFDNYYCKIFSTHPNLRDNEDFDRRVEEARDVIQNKLSFVGFQEYMGLSLLSLNSMLGTDLKIETQVNLGKYS
ncbi:MAG TPA: sulfotransferase family 2 domain-containing protein, partial [Thiolinea sp.]|nr:sulfotransferase family 2 domain-containing protein [Thiolinea sp.]